MASGDTNKKTAFKTLQIAKGRIKTPERAY
jgi:hypothetical protein